MSIENYGKFILLAKYHLYNRKETNIEIIYAKAD
jgi:hypothetical protein